MKKAILAAFVLAALYTPIAPAQSSDIPHLEKKDGRYAFIVDGKPFLVLGGQINNSSAWPATLPAAWSAAEALHMNTVETPVYWEQMEPTKGTFDFSNVDLLVAQAREHKFHLVLLWFGTWKNGQNHYVPEWIKSDTKTYPREENAYGKLLDVMSPNSAANLEADKTAFAALLGHVKTIDAAQHTVIMIQVENESGSVGSIRDFSPAAQKQFDAAVPAEFARAMHLPTGGTWSKTFGPDADESFAAYSTAHYIGEVAAAGKAVYPLPMYCNVWFAYPVHALENRDRPSAGQEYPSGGPQQANIPIWKAAAPAIDILAPDFYSDDFSLFRSIVATYERADNPLFIPESQLGPNFGRYFFYALGQRRHRLLALRHRPLRAGHAACRPGPRHQTVPPRLPTTSRSSTLPAARSPGSIWKANCRPRSRTRARRARPSTLPPPTRLPPSAFRSPTELTRRERPPCKAVPWLRSSARWSSWSAASTRASASTLPAAVLQQTPNLQLEILRAEEGKYVDGVWQTTRILNGDQTDRGLNFRSSNPPLVRIHLHTLPLYDEAIHRKS